MNYYTNQEPTWGNIQIESLKKMFLNNEAISEKDLEKFKEEKKYKTYLNAMANAYNEVITYINNKKPFIKEMIFENETDSKKTEDLNLIFANYYAKRIINTNELEISNNFLSIPKKSRITVKFEVYPRYMSNDTPKEEKLEIGPDIAKIIPLYIAGELYKEDDITLSTMYMNEFYSQISAVLLNNPVEIEQITDFYGGF